MLARLIIELLAASPTIAEDVARIIEEVKADHGGVQKAASAANGAAKVAATIGAALAVPEAPKGT